MSEQPIDLDGIVQALDAVVWEAQGEPRAFTFVSQGAERLLGHPVSAWLTDPAFLDHLTDPADRDRVRATVAAAVAERGAYQLTYRVRAADGGVRWLHERGRAGTTPDGRVRLRGLLSDVTERGRAGAEEHDRTADREQIRYLESLNDMKDSFLAAVSHEMRTPLSAILGIALTLERSGVRLTDAVADDLIRRLAGNARKLDQLLTDLLDLDRLQRGMLLPERSRTDLAALVRRVVEESGVATDHAVALDTSPAVAAVDPAKTERILENLLTNTRRHTPAGTPVWVRVRREGDGVMLVVEDGGPGVPESERETIFEPFHQADPPSAAGVGVGLSLVARFAELHGGRAWVQDRPGGGASFRVFLPDEPAVQPQSARS